eukprot:TRINITY_DN2458_c0_g1_i1.p2 TRINITY_DN2458_c0_g1~~TRINITY_DN2458_c0_g1_i1.p2  ORF type:complete len:465 (+),score=206.00 TRINITY_DN2458_c0_g1_i1:60-1397(+)
MSTEVQTRPSGFLNTLASAIFGNGQWRGVRAAVAAAAVVIAILRILKAMRPAQSAASSSSSAAAEPPAAVRAPSAALPAGLRRFTMPQVSAHNKPDDCWIVVNGCVYDVTKYLDEHPGGGQVILEVAGKDCTEEFEEIGHSDEAIKEMYAMCVGVIGDAAPPPTFKAAPAVAAPAAVAAAAPLVTLNPQAPVDLRLVEKESLSRNVRRFRFALPTPQHQLGLPIGKHFTISFQEDGKTTGRAYTPVTGDEVDGYVDLVIKVYFANEHPKFPLGGKLSQYIEKLPIGGSMTFKGPIGKWQYHGCGKYSYKGGDVRKVRKFNMIAGGTGITPMLQVLRAMLRDAEDTSEVSLLFANQSPDDIILRDEIDSVAKEHPTRFRRWYTVDKAEEAWDFSVGFIDEKMVRSRLFPAGDDTITLLCGPPPMIKFACHPNLDKCGHPETTIYSF